MNIQPPLVSVIIPAFNAEKYIGEAIGSILAQTYKNFELIIINDGSTDNTAEIILSYNDERIKYINNEANAGISRSRNKGIRHSKGKYIAVLDSDDIAARDRLEIQVKYLENKPDIAVCGSYYRAFSKNHSSIIRWPLMPEQIKARLFFENPIGHSTTMISSKIFKEDNIWYDESFKVALDFDLWCRISRKHNIANLPFVLADYRIHPSQVSSVPVNQRQADQIILTKQAEFLLKRKLTEKEKTIHIQLLCRDKGLNIPPPGLETITEWSELLIDTNNSNNVYDRKIFNNEMARYLLHSSVKCNTFKI